MEKQIEKENVKDVAATLATSMDNTQKNATDIEELAKQVLSMSDQDGYKKMVDTILENEDLEMSEKVEYLLQLKKNQESSLDSSTKRVISLQEAKTESTGKASDKWGENWGFVILGIALTFVITTPEGHRLLRTATSKLLAV